MMRFTRDLKVYGMVRVFVVIKLNPGNKLEADASDFMTRVSAQEMALNKCGAMQGGKLDRTIILYQRAGYSISIVHRVHAKDTT